MGDVYSSTMSARVMQACQAVLFDVAGAYREREFPRVESLAGLQNWLREQSVSQTLSS